LIKENGCIQQLAVWSENNNCRQHCIAKIGAGHRNFSSSNIASSVWGLTRSNKLYGNFIIIFLFSISTGAGPAMNILTSAMQTVVMQWWPSRRINPDLAALQSEKNWNHSFKISAHN
jgi:hypothetical protein